MYLKQMVEISPNDLNRCADDAFRLCGHNNLKRQFMHIAHDTVCINEAISKIRLNSDKTKQK